MAIDYQDQDGNHVTLDKLCELEPAWAAGRIRCELARAVRAERLCVDMYDKTDDWLDEHRPGWQDEVEVMRKRHAIKVVTKQSKPPLTGEGFKVIPGSNDGQ